MKILRNKSKKMSVIEGLIRENTMLRKRNKELVKLCKVKDSYFMEMISDGLRHHSPLAAKHMADRRTYLRSK